MDNIKDELYKLHNKYINVSFDMQCLLTLLDKVEYEALQNDKDEMKEITRTIMIVINDIKNRFDCINNDFDRMLIKNDK